MQLTFSSPSPLDYFATLVGSDADFPLLEAMAAVAMDDHPDLDVQQVPDQVDEWLLRLRRRLAPDASPLQRLRLLNRFFFVDLGLGGQVNHQVNDPSYSHLHQVLHTRRGVAVVLAAVWLELARGIGLKAQGINFPLHFMLKVALPQGQVIMDALTGQSLTRDDLSERLEPFRRHHGLVGEFDVPVDLFLVPCSPRDMVASLLLHLKILYHGQRDWPRMLGVTQRMVLLLPDAWDERRDRGLTWAELDRPEFALADLTGYLEHTDNPPDLDVITTLVEELRRVSGIPATGHKKRGLKPRGAKGG